MEEKREALIKDINIKTLVWIFTVGSFLGYLAEMLWYRYQRGHFINRQGVIYGPFSPIYGFGAVLVTLALYRLRECSAICILFVSGLIGAGFEYLCAIAQEEILGTYSWDYSSSYFNIDGKVDLRMTVTWGVFGYLFIRYIYPIFLKLLSMLQSQYLNIFTVIIAVFMIFNMGISLMAAKRMTDRRNHIESTSIITELLDKYYPDEYLNEIFTNVKIVKE